MSAPVRPTRIMIRSRRGRRRHRRPLERSRPAGPLMQRAEPLLLRVVVDLDDDPVDLVVELPAAALPDAAAISDLVDRLEAFCERVDRKPVFPQPLQGFPMGSELRALVRPDAVSPERQRPRGGDARVLLPQRARGGVARVRCRLLPLVGKSFVQLAKTGERHVHLASHFDELWRVSTEHAQWDRADRAQIDGHVLSDLTVAARCSACEHPALVREIDREAVDLRLEDISDRRAVPEALVDVLGPLLDRLLGCHLLERAHRGEVLNLLEPGRAGAPTRCVGESGVTSSGCARSSSTSSS